MTIIPSNSTGSKVMTLIDLSGSNSPEQWSPIDITSDPSGAEVWIDGVDQGVETPASIDVAPGTEHSIYVTLCGETSFPQLKTANKYDNPIDSENPLDNVAVSFVLSNKCYTFDGFYDPIDMNGVINSAKAGKAVPVKWHLSNKTGDVSNPASFVNLYSESAKCPNSNEDVIENYTTGSSGLRYIGSGNWQYNWNTLTSYAGTCRNVYVQFDSGQKSPFAFFTFTK